METGSSCSTGTGKQVVTSTSTPICLDEGVEGIEHSKHNPDAYNAQWNTELDTNDDAPESISELGAIIDAFLKRVAEFIIIY